MGILPACSSRCQNCLAKYVPVSCCRLGPIFPDRAPGIAKTFFVGVPVLRNNRCNPLGVSHSQTETGRRAIVEYVDPVPVDLEYLYEGIDCERQSIERVRILAFRRHIGESETWKV